MRSLDDEQACQPPTNFAKLLAPPKMPLTKFIAGKWYSTRSIGDHNCIFKYKVLRRTEKTVWLERDVPVNKNYFITRKISEWQGVEQFWPEGKHSFAPIISADKCD